MAIWKFTLSHANIHVHVILYTAYISRGFYFRKFRESGSIREFNTTRKIYLRSRRMNATPGMRLVYAILVQWNLFITRSLGP